MRSPLSKAIYGGVAGNLSRGCGTLPALIMKTMPVIQIFAALPWPNGVVSDMLLTLLSTVVARGNPLTDVDSIKPGVHVTPIDWTSVALAQPPELTGLWILRYDTLQLYSYTRYSFELRFRSH